MDWPAGRARWDRALYTTGTKALTGHGLAGDRAASRRGGPRQVTLFQAEHLTVIGALLGVTGMEASASRRNLFVAGTDLLTLRDRRLVIGAVLLEATGNCRPCSRVEHTLGAGDYNAMRGHGAITARVHSPGTRARR